MKKSRILSILLSMVLVLNFIPMTAFAADGQAIEEVTVTLPEVIAKDQIGDTFPLHVTIPDGAAYTVSSADWLDEEGNPRKYSVYVRAGQTQRARIVLKETDPNKFQENMTITAEGGTVENSQYDAGNGTLTLTVSVVVKALEITPIENVSIDVTAPPVGGKVGDYLKGKDGSVVAIPEGQGYGFPQEYSSYALSWYDGETRMGDSETFAQGETYTLYVQLQTNDKMKDFTDNTTVTVNGEGTFDKKESVGTTEWHTTLTVHITVEYTGAHNVTVVNGTADRARAPKDAEITVTAAPPETAYPADTEFSIAGWYINGTWDNSTETTRTITMPDADLSVMVRYNAVRDTSIDRSKVTVDRSLTIMKDGTGEYSGRVYDETLATTFDKTGAGDEPAATMFTAAEAARDAKIKEIIGDLEYQSEGTVNTSEEGENYGEKPAPSVKYISKDGTEVDESSDYVIRLSETQGNYGKEMKYVITERITCTTPPDHVHTWGDGVVTKEPTQTTTGEKTYTCTGCGATRVETIPMIPINYVKVTLDACEGHDAVAKKVEEYVNKTAADDIKSEAKGTQVSLYLDERLNVRDAEDAISKILGDAGILDDNGQRWEGRTGLRPTGGYADHDEYWNSERADDSENGGKPITQDTVFYINWNDPVSSADLTIKAPVAGGKVKLTDEQVPDNRPVVTAKGENAKLQTIALTIWQGADQEKGFFTGTFVNGTEYAAAVFITPAYGYYMAPDYKVTVNGKELPELNVSVEDSFVHLRSLHKAYKLKNTLQAKGRTVKAKAKTLKKKSVNVSRKKAITVKKAKGKLTYSKVKVLKGSKKASKKITKKFVINKKTGKITLKKGIKKGTYKFRIKVKAAGTNMYKAGTKTVTVKIRVK